MKPFGFELVVFQLKEMVNQNSEAECPWLSSCPVMSSDPHGMKVSREEWARVTKTGDMVRDVKQGFLRHCYMFVLSYKMVNYWGGRKGLEELEKSVCHIVLYNIKNYIWNNLFIM